MLWCWSRRVARCYCYQHALLCSVGSAKRLQDDGSIVQSHCQERPVFSPGWQWAKVGAETIFLYRTPSLYMQAHARGHIFASSYFFYFRKILAFCLFQFRVIYWVYLEVKNSYNINILFQTFAYLMKYYIITSSAFAQIYNIYIIVYIYSAKALLTCMELVGWNPNHKQIPWYRLFTREHSIIQPTQRHQKNTYCQILQNYSKQPLFDNDSGR